MFPLWQNTPMYVRYTRTRTVCMYIYVWCMYVLCMYVHILGCICACQVYMRNNVSMYIKYVRTVYVYTNTYIQYIYIYICTHNVSMYLKHVHAYFMCVYKHTHTHKSQNTHTYRSWCGFLCLRWIHISAREPKPMVAHEITAMCVCMYVCMYAYLCVFVGKLKPVVPHEKTAVCVCVHVHVCVRIWSAYMLCVCVFFQKFMIFWNDSICVCVYVYMHAHTHRRIWGIQL
jgi:hypothetical protein